MMSLAQRTSPYSSNVLRTQALWQVILAGGLLGFLRFFPISPNPPFLYCGFHWLTGRPCPLCGMTRALSFLAKGSWEMALSFHPLSPLVFVFLVGLLTTGTLRVACPHLPRPLLPRLAAPYVEIGCLFVFLLYVYSEFAC
jgi:hypothetical protein